MFARYVLALCLLAIVGVNADSVKAVVKQEDNFDVAERFNPAIAVVAKIIAKLFTGAAANCLMEAAKECKSHWKNPIAALVCGKNFLKANKGRCALGK